MFVVVLKKRSKDPQFPSRLKAGVDRLSLDSHNTLAHFRTTPAVSTNKEELFFLYDKGLGRANVQ